MYDIYYTKKALKDQKLIENHPVLDENVFEIVKIIKNNPYQNPPPYEKLKGDLKGHYSRRINNQHRFVYKVDDSLKEVLVLSMWSHYDF